MLKFPFDRRIIHAEKTSEFVDSPNKELQDSVGERKDDINACRKQFLYLEANSRR